MAAAIGAATRRSRLYANLNRVVSCRDRRQMGRRAHLVQQPEAQRVSILLGFAVAIGSLPWRLGCLSRSIGLIQISPTSCSGTAGSAVTLPRCGPLPPTDLSSTGAGLGSAWHVMQRLGDRDTKDERARRATAVLRRYVPRKPAARTLRARSRLGAAVRPVARVRSSSLVRRVGRGWGARSVRRPTRTVFVGCASVAAHQCGVHRPLAGAFFALEETGLDSSVASFSPWVVSSVDRAVVSRAVFGNHPAFPILQQYGYGSNRRSHAVFLLLGL